MAYTNSVLLQLQTAMLGLHTEAERRLQLNPVMMMMLKNQAGLFSNLDQIIDSEGVITSAVYFQRTTGTVSHARSADFTGDVGTSAARDLTFQPYVRTFSSSSKDAMHNTLGSQFLANEFYNAWADIIADIETDAIAHLESNRSSVNAYAGSFGSFADSLFSIEYKNREIILDIIRSMMKGNAYKRNFDLVYSSDIEVLLRKFAAQGAANQTNLVYQFPGFVQAGVSNDFSLTAGETGQFYVSEEGTTGMVARIPKMNMDGKVSTVGEWTNVEDPFGFGIRGALCIRDTIVDSGTNTQDLVKQYELSVDVAFGEAPLSPVGKTVIFKGALLQEGLD